MHLWYVEHTQYLHLLFIFVVFGCKLNSLILVDLFIQKASVGSSLQNTPVLHLRGYLSLQVINFSDYTHSTAQVVNMFGFTLSMERRLVNGGCRRLLYGGCS